MKLLDGGRAPNPRRVRIFLAEKGLEIPLEPVDIGKKEHYSLDFLRLNPMRRLPVLVLDDGTALSETMAICRYFEALHPDPALFGKTALEQAQVEMWNRRIELDLYALVAAIFRHSHPAMAELENQVPEWAAACRERLPELFAFLDREMRGREFIAGDSFSVADITALVTFDFMKPAKVDIPEDFAALRDWHARLKARPSASA
ncbi:glutathione S-transferase [Afifella sp. H1R]|uniref:glutathione S-transferase family protein n=1 Tax=Afifella sp. H1R TaxID=2908841 RepID=UPI001F3A3C83|nr:glutathione S-transferase [Afifella sp. H1R]